MVRPSGRLPRSYKAQRLNALSAFSAQEAGKDRVIHRPALMLAERLTACQPAQSLGQAVNYFLNDYDALLRYLEQGRFEIDNNLVENDIRPAAVGRKRWLFIGHPNAGWRSAVIYSLLISARRRGLNPQHYLTDILGRLPATKITEISQLLPGHWRPDSGPVRKSKFPP